TYETNPLSQISKIKTYTDPNSLASQDSFSYDRLGRLIMKSRSRPGTPGAGIGYNLLDFDAADNLLTLWSNGNASADVAGEFLVNALNQATQSGSTPRLHDHNGNLISDGALVYGWDGHDRLATAGPASAPNRSTWTYDGLSRRAQVTDNG